MQKNKGFLLAAALVIVILIGISLNLTPKQRQINLPKSITPTASPSATLTPKVTPKATPTATPSATLTPIRVFRPFATPTEAIK